MVKQLSIKVKQYIVLILITLAVVLLYCMCHYDSENLFISLSPDKATDSFIERLVQKNDAGESLAFSFSMCEYNIQNMIILLVCNIMKNIYHGVNAYYILSFFAITIAMFWYLKKLHISTGVAVYGAVLVSLLPFHIDRGEGQIVTSTFFMVPIFAGIWNDIIYERKIEKINKGYMTVMCVAPFIDIRLSVMMIILMGILAIHRRNRDVWKTTILYLCPMTIIIFVLNQITSVLGTSDLEKSIQLAREEGMRILDMVMPLRYHVWDRLWNLRYEYDVSFGASGESGLNSMGTLLTIFFIISMCILFFRINVDKRISWMAWISVIVILISNVSGFNIVFEYIGIHLGYWNRMAIFIIVYTVAVMGILIEWLHDYMRNKMNALVLNIGLLLIGAVGILDVLLRYGMLQL